MDLVDIKNLFYYSFEFIKEKTLDKLTDSQKSIGLIALAALSFLTLTFTLRKLYRYRKTRILQKHSSENISKIDKSANQTLKIEDSQSTSYSKPLQTQSTLPEERHFTSPITGNVISNGTLTWKGKAYLAKGEFKVEGDSLSGKGVLTTDKYIFEGVFDENGFSGSKICNANGTRYEGQFTKEGFLKDGKMITVDGYVYQGQLQGSEFVNIKGTIIKDGRSVTYEGNFKIENDHIAGKGSMVDGDISYNGDWKNGKFDGQGKLVMQHQTMQKDSKPICGQVIINGDFKEGLLVRGFKTLPNGEVLEYEGSFTCALESNGRGKRSSLFNEKYTIIYDGIFVADKLEGFGTLKVIRNKNSKELICIEGMFKNGKFNGFGIFSIGNNHLSRGVFTHPSIEKNPILEGPGFIIDGAHIYIGNFKKPESVDESILDGVGCYYNKETGIACFGTFVNNKLVNGVRQSENEKMYHGTFTYSGEDVSFNGVIIESKYVNENSFLHCSRGDFLNGSRQGDLYLYYSEASYPPVEELEENTSLELNHDACDTFKRKAEEFVDGILNSMIRVDDHNESIKQILVNLGVNISDLIGRTSKKIESISKQNQLAAVVTNGKGSIKKKKIGFPTL